MDTESGRGAPEIPVDDWYPAIPHAVTRPSVASAPTEYPPSPPQFGAPDSYEPPQPLARPDLFAAQRTGPSDLFEPNTPRTLKPQRRAPWPAILGTTAVLIIIAGIVAVVALGTGGNQPSPAPAPQPGPSEGTDTASAATDPCAGLQGTLKTHDAGGQDTPLHVVAALEYAYYVKRDKNAVTALYAPGVLNPQSIQSVDAFIKEIPPGTKYCVAASMTGPTSVSYDVNELRAPQAVTPGAPIPTMSGAPAPVTYKMTLTVTPTAPYLIESLGSRTS